MKEKKGGGNETERKKKGVKKKVPKRESNPQPLNLQPLHSYRLRDLLHVIINTDIIIL